MDMYCKELVFGKDKEIGRRERRKGKGFPVNRARIRMEQNQMVICH
jgi:hypothetical protein